MIKIIYNLINYQSKIFQIINTIVFFVAIPFMIVWIVLAFAGICTMKVGYPSFANNIYYTVNKTTAVNGYNEGDILTVKSDGAENVKSGYIVCVEYNDKGNKSLHLLKVTETLGSNPNIQLKVIYYLYKCSFC